MTSSNIFYGKTFAEAKKQFSEIAHKEHPDKGGNPLIYMAVKNMYDEFKNSLNNTNYNAVKETLNVLAAGNETQMQRAELIEAILKETGLNWTMEKQALTTSKGIEIKDKIAIVRTDNNTVLSVMGNGYEVFQNKDLAALIYDTGKEVFNEKAQFVHPWNNSDTLGSLGNIGGGSLRGGEKTFFQLELPTAFIGKSDVKRYITVTNGNDGKTAVGFGTSSQVICCANTFAIANKQISKFKHTADLSAQLEISMHEMRNILQFEQQEMELFNSAANKRIEKKDILAIKAAVFPSFNFSDENDNSTRSKNQMLQLEGAINTSLNEQGETLWALFNGVTRYTNHEAPTQNSTAEEISYNLFFGTLAAQNLRAYEYLKAAI